LILALALPVCRVNGEEGFGVVVKKDLKEYGWVDGSGFFSFLFLVLGFGLLLGMVLTDHNKLCKYLLNFKMTIIVGVLYELCCCKSVRSYQCLG